MRTCAGLDLIVERVGLCLLRVADTEVGAGTAGGHNGRIWEN